MNKSKFKIVAVSHHSAVNSKRRRTHNVDSHRSKRVRHELGESDGLSSQKEMDRCDEEGNEVRSNDGDGLPFYLRIVPSIFSYGDPPQISEMEELGTAAAKKNLPISALIRPPSFHLQ